MVVKRKAIFKKAVKRNVQAHANEKRRLTDAFRGIPKRPGGDGMIRLDPREWNGGFDQLPAQQLEEIYNNQAKYQPPVNAMKSQLQALLQQKMFQKPQPGGPQDGMISLDPREWNGGFDNQMNRGKELFDRQLQNLPHVPGEREQGQEVGAIQQNPHHDMFRRSLQGFRGQPPTRGGGGLGSGNPSLSPISTFPPKQTPMPGRPPGMGGGMIHLDPREWGGNGGFDGGQKQKPMPMPGVPRPPMSGGQKPMPMPQMPNPMKQMPMPNPRRNLIPRPIDPRYKLM